MAIRFQGLYCNVDVDFVWKEYTGSATLAPRPALQLVAANTAWNREHGFMFGEPIATATTNLELAPPRGCIWVKDWSENEGMEDFLKKAGMIEDDHVEQIPSGHVLVRAYRLKHNN